MRDSDLTQLKSWFAGYCKAFYSDNPEDQRNIALKEEHTERVCGNMNLLAESLALGEGDLLLAEAVALFHDVGRFEQYRRYRTFRDSTSENHAAIGARVLAEAGVLKGTPEGERQVIIRAVALHNAFKVPEGLDERSRLFLRLVRDADKLDIWRVFIDYYQQPEEERASAVGLGFPDLPVCSPEVLAALERGEMVNLAALRTLNDFKLLQLSWVFDLNFPASFRLVAEREYIDRIAATLPHVGEVGRAVAVVREFAARKLT